MLDQCRICLSYTRNIVSIFSFSRILKSYAQMLTTVAKVKITKDDKISCKICNTCSKKLVDLYEFKMLIEKSDNLLQGLKRICFSNLEDIKIEIDIDDTFLIKKEDVKVEISENEDAVTYCNTTISKVNNIGPVPVMDFLNSIKNESDNLDDFNDDLDDGFSGIADHEYSPPLNKCSKKRKYAKRRKKRILSGKENKCKIKPVILNDIRLVPVRKKCVRGNKKKYVHEKRKDICPYCGKISKAIDSHILIHIGERKYSCNICSRSFYKKGQLNQHKKKHSDVHEFKCDLCVSSFNNKHTLESHMLTHTDNKSYFCNICDKAFKRKTHLHRHQLIHNLANKVVKCELCNMSFFNRTSLRHHMRVHTGERPFNCEICSQPYSYKHDFNRHCYNKHNVFIERRSFKTMNADILARERDITKALMYRVYGIIRDGEQVNPLDGVESNTQAALAFKQAMKRLKAKPLPIEIPLVELPIDAFIKK